MRGNQSGRLVDYSGVKGLSPRVRGNPAILSAPCCPAMRSIPARAGEPRWHPGREGEGSRSIPARAGEPATSAALRASRASVYPRACGGTYPDPAGFRSRSIPARAGEPASYRLLAPPRWNHGLSPRVRGNRQHDALPAMTRRGLSPRVRGNLIRIVMTQSKGLSPRVRGNLFSARIGPFMVYPRACGGTPGGLESRYRLQTVYPRACGGTDLVRPSSGRVLRRSIPARAGEPGR